MTYLPDMMARWFEGANAAPNIFEDEAALGRIRGVYPAYIRARAAQVSGSLVELWGPSTSYTFPTGSAQLFVSSSDTQDAWNSQGCQSVLIDGCGNNYERYQEVLSLSGTTVVTTTGSFIRLNHMTAYQAGSHGTNRGTINAWHNSVLLVSQISSGSGDDGNGVFTVPSGSYGIMRDIAIFCAVDAQMQVRVQARRGPGFAFQNILNVEMYRAQDQFDAQSAVALPEKSDMIVSAFITKAGSVSNGAVSANAVIYIYDPTFDDLEPK